MKMTDPIAPLGKPLGRLGALTGAIGYARNVLRRVVSSAFSRLPSLRRHCAVCAGNIPPHSLEAERSVLGALLVDNAAFDVVAEFLSDDHFYGADHRLIFMHIHELIVYNRLANALTVAESLKRIEKLESVGGRAYIDSLVVNAPSVENVRISAEIVRELSLKRRLVAVSADISASVFSPLGRSATDLLTDAEMAIFSVGQRAEWKSRQGFVDMSPFLTQVVERIDSIQQRVDGSAAYGLPTGFPALDRMTGGLQAGHVVVVAGRPNMGKTAFVLNIAQHVALIENKPAAIFSLGGTGPDLVTRLLCILGYLDQNRMCSGSLTDEDWEKLTQGVKILNDAKIYIDDSVMLTPVALRGRARRLHREGDDAGLGVIVVDCVELMVARWMEGNNSCSGVQIMRALKALAEELKVPILVVFELSQIVERQDKRPIMSDLREFGSIAQAADLVLFIHREEVDFPENLDARGKAEVIIGRQRNGPTGTVNLTFLNQGAAFERQVSEESVL